jgi:AcrR family transcriptional regulator
MQPDLLQEPDDTRQRLIDAAGPIFAEKGCEAASVREICLRADANVSAVNYYFRSKEQLYIETVRFAYLSCSREVPMPTWAEGTPARQRLRDFIRAFLIRVVEHPGPPWHSLLMWREAAQPTAACAEFVRDFVRPTFGQLLDVLRDMTPPDLPGDKLRMIAGSIVGQCLHHHHSRHIIAMLVGEEEARNLTVDRLTEHITEFSLAALERLYPEQSRPRGGRPEKKRGVKS